MKLDAGISITSNNELLRARDLSSDFNNAKTTLSSWDGCMSKAYCKWPVIVAIIVGALIIASIVFCCARCCCCGLECCCGCFRCCNACCPSPREKKQSQTPQQPPAYGQPYGQWNGAQRGPQPWNYQPPTYNAAPQQPQPHDLGMMSGALKSDNPKSAPATSSNVAFETSKPKQEDKRMLPYKNPTNEDQLPAMPTWGAASERQVLDESYHPPAESPPPLESEIAKATGQEGVLLQNQSPQRRPTLPNMEGSASEQLSLERRPTLPQLDTPSGVSSPAYGSSTALPPGSQSSIPSGNGRGYGAGAGAAAGGLAAGAAYGSQRNRGPDSRQQTPANTYGYGAPPRRPSGRQPSPYNQGYPPREPSPRAVSPISPITPGPQSAGGYSANPPPSYRTNNNASAPPLPAYASRQGSQNQGPRGAPQTNAPPMPYNQGYPPPGPSRTPPAQGYGAPGQGYGPPPPSPTPPAQGYPPPQQSRSPLGQGYGAPPSARTPPPNQRNAGYNGSAPPMPQPAYQGYGAAPPQQSYQGYSNAPQRAPSAPRPAPAPAPQQGFQPYMPYQGGQANNTAGRAELGGADELHGAQGPGSGPRYELAGPHPAQGQGPRCELGGGDGVGEGGEWQRRPPNGWS